MDATQSRACRGRHDVAELSPRHGRGALRRRSQLRRRDRGVNRRGWHDKGGGGEGCIGVQRVVRRCKMHVDASRGGGRGRRARQLSSTKGATLWWCGEGEGEGKGGDAGCRAVGVGRHQRGPSGLDLLRRRSRRMEQMRMAEDGGG
jgi:hypothetical protein